MSGCQGNTGKPQTIQNKFISPSEWSANPSLTVRMMRPESGHQAAGLGVGIVWYVCDNSSSYMKCTIQLSYMSVWPSGLRRQLQVLFFFGRRGFEPLSGHNMIGSNIKFLLPAAGLHYRMPCTYLFVPSEFIIISCSNSELFFLMR